ncbi:hypothetical protein C7M18_03518 [Bacillus velezensis]|nr:hypothetical protein O205_18275 [Bacillus amyloliquefaciens EGD-AQ14]QHK04620.1 hypothetical protein C7M18_03518 [Bacillus velezensis]
MPVIDNFFVIQFENDDYFKSFKLEGSGYIVSKGIMSLLSLLQCQKL